MAATIGLVSGGSENVWGRQRIRLVTITGDASYPTGGYALTGNQFGLRSIDGIIVLGCVTAATGIMPYWNTTTQKWQLFYPTNGATSPNAGEEIPNGTSVSTITFTVAVLSIDD
jgi:hypothetical protein